MEYTQNPIYYQYAVQTPQTQNPNPNFPPQQTSVYIAEPNLNQPAVDPNSYAYGAAGSSYGLCSYYPDPNEQNWATYSDHNAHNWTAAQQYEANQYAMGVAVPQYGTTQLVSKTSYATTTTTYPTTQTRMYNYRPAKIKTTSPMYCDVCKIVCNTQEVFSKHRLGKKHKKNTEKLKASLQPAQPQYQLQPRTDNNGPIIGPPENPALIQSGTESKYASCDICKVVCNTKLVLAQHCQGKKHISKAAKTSQPNQPPVTLAKPDEDAASGKRPRRKSAADSKEDLEMKKRKLLEGGMSANAAKTCLLCNVICNSDIVFNFHLHGARHNAVVKKLASSTVTEIPVDVQI